MAEVAQGYFRPDGNDGSQGPFWPSVVISRAMIVAEVERLSDGPRDALGRRRSLIVHPEAQAPGLGLTPGIQVCLDVLLPGEASAPVRHNSAAIHFVLAGVGSAMIDGEELEFALHDVWTVPSMSVYAHTNHSRERHVRLSFSNAALLEKLRVNYTDTAPPLEQPLVVAAEAEDEATEILRAVRVPISDDGAELVTYEALVNPPVVEQRVHHWTWSRVQHELDQLATLGPEYAGRRLYLLYNPSTGHTQGTAPGLFATMAVLPPNTVDRPHRHIAAAINYWFEGAGYSVVDGQRYEWSAGDLMLSAPGWAIHHHASVDQTVHVLTVQDSPLHLSLDSLLWQEDLKGPMVLLGSSRGFRTNRPALRRKPR